MKNVVRRSILAVAAWLIAAIAHATSSLWFEGGGYRLDLEIGHTDRPVVASITFHVPGDAEGVVLRDNYDVKRFDADRRELVVEYEGSDPRVEPFTLVVHGEEAILRIGRSRIESGFDWFM